MINWEVLVKLSLRPVGALLRRWRDVDVTLKRLAAPPQEPDRDNHEPDPERGHDNAEAGADCGKGRCAACCECHFGYPCLHPLVNLCPPVSAGGPVAGSGCRGGPVPKKNTANAGATHRATAQYRERRVLNAKAGLGHFVASI